MRRCSRCGETKPVGEFAWRRKWKGQLDTFCRPCRSAYHREHYLAHRQKYIDQARRRKVAVSDQNTKRIVDYLRTHPCVDCGQSDVMVLEFDHLRDKSFGISWGLGEKSWAQILLEIAKCEVVCANCHRRRTALRAGFRRALILGIENPAADLERGRPTEGTDR
jgi:hypothetical protein